MVDMISPRLQTHPIQVIHNIPYQGKKCWNHKIQYMQDSELIKNCMQANPVNQVAVGEWESIIFLLGRDYTFKLILLLVDYEHTINNIGVPPYYI